MIYIASPGKGRRFKRYSSPGFSSGFTLIELLVVISIIALLIAILLPTLQSARSSARSVLCLSNLRQLGVSVYGYSNDFENYIIPSEVRPSRDTYAQILVDGEYIIGPDIGTVAGPVTPSGLRCPDALAEAYPGGTPTSQVDPLGARMWFSAAANTVGTHYGINGSTPNGTSPPDFPSTVVLDSTVPSSWALNRLDDITAASDMALLYDGLRFHRGNPNFINRRHYGLDNANALRCDGSASTFSKADLAFPVMDVATLNNFYPPLKWMTTQ